MRRDAMPAGAELAPVSIEELFVLMVKGENGAMKGLLLKDAYQDVVLYADGSFWCRLL